MSELLRTWESFSIQSQPVESRARRRASVLARAAAETLETRRLLAIITVTGTGDTIAVDGLVTLREAITSTNNNADLNADVTAQHTEGAYLSSPDADTIKFNISGAGVHTISVNTDLPTITDPVIIDGYTQSGAAAATAGSSATLKIELNSANPDGTANGLFIDTINSSVRGLVINSFPQAGVKIDIAETAAGNVVAGNFLGTDPTGTVASGNGFAGVYIIFAGGNTVGGVTPADRNVISGNLIGISLDVGAMENKVQGNYIGTDVTGTLALGNTSNGVQLSQATENFIGGTAAGAGNVISGNSLAGIHLSGGGGGVANNLVQGNFIGTNAAGTAAIPNGAEGVALDGARDVTIGGTVAGARNIISGNGADGVDVFGGATGNVIQGNYIGTDVSGLVGLGNTFTGVAIRSADGNLIGGTDAGAGNVISGNPSFGVVVSRCAATVQGNLIGTDKLGAVAIPNGGPVGPGGSSGGIDIFQAGPVLVGGTVAAARNVISGNAGDGINLLFSLATIQGNYIGVNAAGTGGLGNVRKGIANDEATTTIGGTVPAAGNIIAYNKQDGVAFNSVTNTIRLNSIFSNDELGIDFNDDGITPNDPGDTVGGQNFPLLGSAISSGGSTTVQGVLNTSASKPCFIDFYVNDGFDPSGLGEGQTYLGTQAVTTDAGGNATFTVTFPVAIAAGKYITATATTGTIAPGGLTSEFSQAIQVTGTTPPPTTVFLSDLNPTSATNGWGQYERDKSNGENGAHDGHTLTLNTQTFAKGLGVHANSDLRYALNGNYTRYTARVGVDDEVGSNGNLIFQVWADGVKLFDSGPMTGSSATKDVDVNLTGRNQLKLLVLSNGSNAFDHADWADAKIYTNSTPPPPPDAFLSDLTPTSATNGWGAFENDKSNGENGAHDGHTITLNAQTYARGLGVHANSDLRYAIGGRTHFHAFVGIDDEVGANGNVIFRVFVDGVQLFDSGPMTGSTATKEVNVNLTGGSELRLQVLSNGSNAFDHADWADAKLHT